MVGEIQKAYNVYASILQREANEAFETAKELKEGPLALSKDHEWDNFVSHSQQMVDPRAPVRDLKNITYTGKDHPAAIEVRSGMLERKSKYLKNYTPGWYVGLLLDGNCSNKLIRYILSPTHLHEFKSADRISTQTPVMSLYLPEQKLGSHSEPGSSSHKFMLKGSQTGGMHRGHAWVFRAESHDTMMAWFNDIKELTEKRGEERNDFVRRTHARSLSGNQKPPSIGSGNSMILQEDEADAVPYSSERSVRGASVAHEGAEGGLLIGAPDTAAALDDNRSEAGWRPPNQRPSPGGRFPSTVDVNRGLQAAPQSPSSAESDREILAEAGALPGSGVPFDNSGSSHPHSQLQRAESTGATSIPPASATYTPGQHPQLFQPGHSHEADSQYGEWMAPIAGVGAVAAGGAALHQHQYDYAAADPTRAPATDSVTAIPVPGSSSAPIGIVGADEDHDRSLSRPRGLTGSTQATTTTHGASQYGAASSSVGGATLSTVPTSVAATEEHERFSAADGPKEIGPLDIAMPPPSAPTTTNNAGSTNTSRPVLSTNERQKSVQTISDLHVPGEYPGRGSAVGSEVM